MIPPVDLDAERAVLGAALYDPESAAVVADVDPLAYHAEQHRAVASAIRTLVRAGQDVDHLTVRAAQEAEGTWDAGHGATLLAGLTEAATVGSALGEYVRLVTEAHARRELMRLAGLTLASAADLARPLADTFGQHLRDVLALEQGATPEAILTPRRYAEALATPDRAVGVETGIPILDALAGGLRPANLTVIAARPRTGKTALAVQIGYHVAVTQGLPILFLSLEMTAREIGHRLHALVLETALPRPGELGGFLPSGLRQIGESGFHLADPTAPRLDRVIGLIRRAVIRHGVVLVIVDHVGKILPLSGRYGSRHLELATIVSGLKDTARSLSIPVLLLVQLNRDVERRQVARPVLADLRESGALEEEAGVVIFLWTKQPPEEWGPDVAVEMTAAKVRWGETGERVMTFRRRYGMFA